MILHLQSVPPGNGFLWVRHGLKVFQRKPFALLGLFGLTVLVSLLVSLLPAIGQLLLAAALPLMSLGFMLAAHQVLQSQTPTAAVFVQPLRLTPERRRAQLVLGAICAAALTATFLLSLLLDGGALLRLLEMRDAGQSVESIQAAATAEPSLMIGQLMRMGLLLLVALPFTQAPALIHWGGQGVGQALFSSVLGIWRNKGAYALSGLAWIGLTFVSMMALSLVVLLLNLVDYVQYLTVPLAMVLATAQLCSMYFVFIDCFMFGAPRDLPDPKHGSAVGQAPTPPAPSVPPPAPSDEPTAPVDAPAGTPPHAPGGAPVPPPAAPADKPHDEPPVPR